jgi:hypothetical protein
MSQSIANSATIAGDLVNCGVVDCDLVGIGAWGPGFNNWVELQAVLADPALGEAQAWTAQVPKPEIIPANERRRAPLPVRAAVEVSTQALLQSGLAASDVACVFGSGLGDTEITDYMCRVLTTAEKQLSPTKFHNSVHNAAAGYWTISSGCMKSANSIAAYHNTAGLALLEAMIQCQQHQEPVLITLFDTAAQDAYQQIVPCTQHFAAALLLVPAGTTSASALARLTMSANVSTEVEISAPALPHSIFDELYRTNPAAKLLGLLQQLATKADGVSQFALSTSRPLSLQVICKS